MINNLAIKLINKILDSNQGSRKLLIHNSGKSFKINLVGFSVAGKIDIDGYIISPDDKEFTVIINIPLDASTYLVDKDKIAIYKKIGFAGDTKFGRKLLEIIANLHLSGIYSQVNSPLALAALNQINNLIKIIQEFLGLMLNNATSSVKEYLLYETGDLITQHENTQFCDAVDDLRSDVDRLEQKIAKASLS
jgi:ubiquinone biosynthesis protein UbiJ